MNDRLYTIQRIVHIAHEKYGVKYRRKDYIEYCYKIFCECRKMNIDETNVAKYLKDIMYNHGCIPPFTVVFRKLTDMHKKGFSKINTPPSLLEKKGFDINVSI